jgi:hypothetical protein
MVSGEAEAERVKVFTRRRRRVAALTRGAMARPILGSGEVRTAVRHTPHSRNVTRG